MARTALQKHLSRIGKMGAKARTAKLSPAERQAIAKNAANKRWQTTHIDQTTAPAETKISE